MTTQRILIFFFLIVSALCGLAQQKVTTSTAERKLQAWRQSRAKTLMDDFGELARYRASNAALPEPAAGENRVVFFGDSITDFWNLAKFFPRKPYVNRGISGQTTAQMLLRFRQDVVNLQPKAVVILAGTNDIAGNTGPMTLETTESNLASMADIARANGIRVVFSSVLPVHNYTAKSENFFPLRPPAKIEQLNLWLKNYCAANGYVYLDYYGPMLNASGLLKREYADDGLHPNDGGYSVMAPLAETAIQKALLAESNAKEKPGN
jgi:lysophospholipase L1-like esterase